jgi:glycosyltransferase involved in cell wall biosynthesis
VVLTVKGGGGIQDRSLCDEVPQSVPVYRASFLGRSWLFRAIYRVLGIRRGGKGSRGVKEVDRKAALGPGLKERIESFMNRWVFLPDRQISWFPYALAMGLRIIREEKVDLIYSTSVPYTAHLVAYFLRSLTGKPWVADFRNAWTTHPIRVESGWRKEVEKFMESQVVKKADKVVSNTLLLKESLERMYPWPSKHEAITNGYDPSDFVGVRPKRDEEGKFIITYAGTFYGRHTPKFFLEGLSGAFKEWPEMRSSVAFVFVGHSHDENLRLMAEELGIGDAIILKGHLERRECISYMLGSDLLLLVLYDGRVFTTKVFEYLLACKPILALSPEGINADLVRRAKAGIVIPPMDVPAIKEGIRSMYTLYKEGRLKIEPDMGVVGEFDWRKLTGKLAEVFNRVLA